VSETAPSDIPKTNEIDHVWMRMFNEDMEDERKIK
jgi:hypothetical protein